MDRNEQIEEAVHNYFKRKNCRAAKIGELRSFHQGPSTGGIEAFVVPINVVARKTGQPWDTKQSFALVNWARGRVIGVIIIRVEAIPIIMQLAIEGMGN